MLERLRVKYNPAPTKSSPIYKKGVSPIEENKYPSPAKKKYTSMVDVDPWYQIQRIFFFEWKSCQA